MRSAEQGTIKDSNACQVRVAAVVIKDKLFFSKKFIIFKFQYKVYDNCQMHYFL